MAVEFGFHYLFRHYFELGSLVVSFLPHFPFILYFHPLFGRYQKRPLSRKTAILRSRSRMSTMESRRPLKMSHMREQQSTKKTRPKDFQHQKHGSTTNTKKADQQCVATLSQQCVATSTAVNTTPY